MLSSYKKGRVCATHNSTDIISLHSRKTFEFGECRHLRDCVTRFFPRASCALIKENCRGSAEGRLESQSEYNNHRIDIDLTINAKKKNII